MYPRILVPLDGSALAEEVLPYAKALVKGLNIRVDLLRVVESPPNEMADSTHGVFPHRLSDSIKNSARDYLEGIAHSLREEGFQVFSKAREGNPADCIIAEAELEPDTLIAMSSHGRSGISRWVLGSVADKVLHSTRSPLLLARASQGEKEGISGDSKVENLLVPLDGSFLADQVVPHVAALAHALGSKVHLVRANPTMGEYHSYMGHYPLDSSANIYTQMYEEFSKEADAQAMSHLHDVKERLQAEGILAVEEVLLRGKAAEIIVELAQETPKSLVVMSSHGRSGMGRWILGSVSDKVARHSGVPVLIIRPATD